MAKRINRERKKSEYSERKKNIEKIEKRQCVQVEGCARELQRQHHPESEKEKERERERDRQIDRQREREREREGQKLCQQSKQYKEVYTWVTQHKSIQSCGVELNIIQINRTVLFAISICQRTTQCRQKGKDRSMKFVVQY